MWSLARKRIPWLLLLFTFLIGCGGAFNAPAWQASVGDTKVDVARAVGMAIAERAKAAGVSSVVLDRGGYQYHGRVRSLAEGAREGGLVLLSKES